MASHLPVSYGAGRSGIIDSEDDENVVLNPEGFLRCDRGVSAIFLFSSVFR